MSAIRAANPAVLISENVAEAQYSPAYVLLKTELERLGYEIFERVMDAADTGSIEHRKRYWFVALSRGLAPGFSFDALHPEAHAPKKRLADIFEEEITESAWADHQYLKDKALRCRCRQGLYPPAAHRRGNLLRDHRAPLQQAALHRALRAARRRQGAPADA